VVAEKEVEQKKQAEKNYNRCNKQHKATQKATNEVIDKEVEEEQCKKDEEARNNDASLMDTDIQRYQQELPTVTLNSTS
jgi:hypothetical protein